MGGMAGFRGQNMAPTPVASAYAANIPEGVTSFVVPFDGRYKFHAWGGGWHGDGASAAGASGAYLEITKALSKGQTVTVSVGKHGGASNPTSSVLTFPDGTVATAGAGASRATAGVATGGDVNLDGSVGGTGGGSGANGLGTGGGPGGAGDGASINGGAGAPGALPMRGGRGGTGGGSATVFGGTPGGGGRSNDGGGGAPVGGAGAIIVLKL